MTWNLVASRRVVFAPLTIATGLVLMATATAALSVLFGLSVLDGTLPWCVLGAAAGFATSGSV